MGWFNKKNSNQSPISGVVNSPYKPACGYIVYGEHVFSDYEIKVSQRKAKLEKIKKSIDEK